MDSSSKEDMELMLKRSLLSRSKLATITKDLEGVTRYICVVCNVQYDDKEELEVHLCSHFKEYRFLCSICGTGLKRREHLDRHMQGHMEVRPYSCEECGKAFKRREHLNIHKSIHKGVKTLQCSLCSKCFYRKDHLQKHIQTHNKHFLEQNIIPMSDQELSIKEEIEDDFEDITPIITSVSGNVTDPDASMESEEYGSDQQQSMDETSMDHSEEHTVTLDHAKNARPFVCNVCGKSYKRKDHLKIHSWAHAKKEVICKLCGKEFHMEEQMLVHVNMVHLKSHETASLSHLQTLLGNDIEVEILNNEHLVPRKVKEERAHECPICHRKFKRKQHLKVHANVHLKKKRTYFCNVCHEGFHDDTDHANHVCPGLVKNEPEEGDDEYEIEQNGHSSYEQTSPNGDARKENYPHDLLEVVVEEAVIPSPQRVFVCKYCGKAFRRKDHYKIHLHIHTGHKSFFCPTCDKGFYRKDHLQKHMIVHAKSKLKLPTKSQKSAQELRPPPPFDGPLRQQSGPKKKIPDLLPIAIKKEETKKIAERKDFLPEITIHAPSSAKIRVPLQIKVPYQMVMSMDNGEQRAVTVDPTHPQAPEEVDTEENILPD
ncbi:zinc finger protein 436-like isoform X2 [Pieris brassicae]|uniref:C2H2-type domain-containing protein n=1 Tax=Pieris brassicae TaxID=7116 RepID=A0A9P0XC53_PIEBR|nr:zinc finger protein 436-like isoform X2 [Pieris brassicae]CAH4032694.1 unnamed protein product [Pieris brassicae]